MWRDRFFSKAKDKRKGAVLGRRGAPDVKTVWTAEFAEMRGNAVK